VYAEKNEGDAENRRENRQKSSLKGMGVAQVGKDTTAPFFLLLKKN
jgi:hypothetical protein